MVLLQITALTPSAEMAVDKLLSAGSTKKMGVSASVEPVTDGIVRVRFEGAFVRHAMKSEMLLRGVVDAMMRELRVLPDEYEVEVL